jgi:hypothetical protein
MHSYIIAQIVAVHKYRTVSSKTQNRIESDDLIGSQLVGFKCLNSFELLIASQTHSLASKLVLSLFYSVCLPSIALTLEGADLSH